MASASRPSEEPRSKGEADPLPRGAVPVLTAAIAYSHNGQRLAVGAHDGSVVVLDALTLKHELQVCSRTSAVTVIKYSPDGQVLASGGRDGQVQLHRVHRELDLYATCRGHSSRITAIDWSVDSRYLQASSAAGELLYFDAITGHLLVKDQKDETWSTWSSTLGFPVLGIWAPGTGFSDINGCQRSNDQSLLATVDDFSQVRLFNYPCVVRNAPALTYAGHASHVADVCFLHHDDVLVTAGGFDRSIFQWAIDGEEILREEVAGPPGNNFLNHDTGPGAKVGSSEGSRVRESHDLIHQVDDAVNVETLTDFRDADLRRESDDSESEMLSWIGSLDQSMQELGLSDQ